MPPGRPGLEKVIVNCGRSSGKKEESKWSANFVHRDVVGWLAGWLAPVFSDDLFSHSPLEPGVLEPGSGLVLVGGRAADAVGAFGAGGLVVLVVRQCAHVLRR